MKLFSTKAFFYGEKGLDFINVGKRTSTSSPIKGTPQEKKNYSQILWRSTPRPSPSPTDVAASRSFFTSRNEDDTE
jgi:hypothetical protein